MHEGRVWEESYLLLSLLMHTLRSRVCELLPGRNTCRPDEFVNNQVFGIENKLEKQEICSVINSNFYQRGAHGVLSSRNGYGHLLEEEEILLQWLMKKIVVDNVKNMKIEIHLTM